MFPPEQASERSQSFATDDSLPAGGMYERFPVMSLRMNTQTDYEFEPLLPFSSKDPYMPPAIASAVDYSEFSLSSDYDLQDPLVPARTQPYSAPNDSRSMRAPDAPQETPHSDRLAAVSMISSINAEAQGDGHLFRSERSLRAVG